MYVFNKVSTVSGLYGLSDNEFFAQLPIWLFNLSGLSCLNLEGNQFHGQTPKNLLSGGLTECWVN